MSIASNVARTGIACLLMGSFFLCGGAGTVLCFGDQDHVEVESSQQSHCDHSHQPKSPFHTDADGLDAETHHVDCARSCIDLQLTVESAPLHTATGKVIIPLERLLPGMMPPGYLSPRCIAMQGSRLPSFAPQLGLTSAIIEKRTIVLRV